VLAKLEGEHSRPGLIQTLSRELRLESHELATLVGVSTETIIWWDEKDSPAAAERLDDLGDVAALLIRDGELHPSSVAGWFRSRNRDLSLQRPLDVLRCQGYLRVLKAAEAAC
jgi:hypothetical protein